MNRQRYTQQQVIDALGETRGLITFAAQRLGCAPNTVYAYCSRHAKVRRALEDARERQLDLAEARLFQAINEGESWAVQFYLRTVGRRRGYGDRLEVDATVDVLQAPAWLRTRGLLLSVLRAYPDAQSAVVRALGGPDGANDDDDDGGGR